ncbi:MAG: hypothetical protein KDD47_07340, partial [Acidobacteria bacterium]|nr:hypothetical protein [Acidobacteriota bacterium]
MLETGTTRGTTDLLTVFTRDASGNAIREQRYGSDLGNAGTGVICSTGLGTEQSRIDHTYQYGVLATSLYRNANGTSVGFLSLDRTIDQRTGLVASSRDAALVQTTYTYDGLGRLTAETPASDASTTYLYNRAVGTGKANVRIRRIANGGTAVREESWLYFDHFGRPEVEKRKMPSGLLSKRTTLRNALSWVTDVSEWESDSGSHTAWTLYRDHDAFGRPTRVVPPDGAGHQVDLSYTGIRVMGRTVRVATGANGAETTATTTERYDRQGRLYQIVEPSAAGGANLTTTYGYDEGDRLSSAATGVQTRTFTYDNRGFLTSECHPEKGTSGGGCMTYASCNAWGLAGRKTDGPNDLRYLYDRAGRMV